MAAWLIIMGSALDDWIYWHLVQSRLITIRYKNSQSNFSRALLPWLPRTRSILVLVLRLTSEKVKVTSQSYVMTDGQSASLSWNKAPIWGLRPDLYYCQTVAGLLMWGALSDERTGLSFTMYNIFTFYMLLPECICNIYKAFVSP
jgi:hypothetical protein